VNLPPITDILYQKEDSNLILTPRIYSVISGAKHLTTETMIRLGLITPRLP